MKLNFPTSTQNNFEVESARKTQVTLKSEQIKKKSLKVKHLLASEVSCSDQVVGE